VSGSAHKVAREFEVGRSAASAVKAGIDERRD